MAADSSVQQIQQRLTCSVCLDKFKQPKLLPCQHTFCLTPCLVNLVDRQTRRIKCPECRTTHMLPMNGVESFPNNITIMGFLDLDLSDVERGSASNAPDKCSLCLQRKEDLIKCLDCSRLFCGDCKSTHVSELKNETKQIVSQLRRTIPKLSEKVGNFEQKQTVIKQNFETVKHDITAIVDRLVEELRTRERCLHAEAEVYYQSQIRTAGLEQENAEIELASVSSFCDASETTLNKQDQQIQDNEVALLKKQGLNYNDEMKSLNIILNVTVNKLKFKAPNLDDLFGHIQNFGELTLLVQSQPQQQQQQPPQHQQPIQQPPAIRQPAPVATNNGNTHYNNYQQQQQQHLSATLPSQPDFRRRRPTWNRNNSQNLDYVNNEENLNSTVPAPSARNSGVNSTQNTARSSIFGPNPFQANENNQRNNNTNRSNGASTDRPTPSHQRNQSNPPQVAPRPGSRPIFGGSGGGGASNLITARSAENNVRRRSPASPRRPGLIRSDTFELDNPSSNSTPHVRAPQNQNNADTSQLYNVRRRARARSPVTFAVMLDEPAANINFDVPTNNSILTEPLLNNPAIDYASKTRAKQTIGRQGRDEGQFVWPIGVTINPIGKHILIADSSNHRVQIFESNGVFVKSVGTQGSRDAQFDCVSDVAVDAMANLYVVDRHNHRVQIFDRYCRFIRSIGSGPGSAPGELSHPWGVAVNRFSEIFVCDKENNRVCVFHLTGRFLRSFGVFGTRPGQFDKPYYVHVTNENKVLVSDCSNHRIQIFDPYGNVLHCIGSEGSGPGQFKHPRGITTDAEGFILVADSGNNRVQVIRPDGSYVCEFGSAGTESGKFRGLEGITIAANGDVIVCDKENHRFQVL